MKQKIFHWAREVGFKYNSIIATGGKAGPILTGKYKLAFKLVFSKLHEKLGGSIEFGVSGGAGTVVNVTVDASGSKVEGNAGQGQQLGRAIAAAVQAELIKQKRPGGLLTL